MVDAGCFRKIEFNGQQNILIYNLYFRYIRYHPVIARPRSSDEVIGARR